MMPYVKGNSVLVMEPKIASTLMNKGNFGKPLPGGGIELSLMEAAYLVESDRLEVKRSRKGRKADHHELLVRGMDSSDRFLENYLVFRDIRNRGMNIQGGDGKTFITYPRGSSPGKGKADNWIMVFREHDPVTMKELHSEASRREKMRMGLLAAVVDGDFDITYYSISTTRTPGSGPLERKNIEFGPDEAVPVPGGGLLSFGGRIKQAGEEEKLGSILGEARAFSTEETGYLTGIRVEGKTERIKDITYRDLRSGKYLVRTGFKYGSHFRVYTSGNIEDHSDLLVQCTLSDEEHTWEVLARAIRLSHSVRKRMLFAFGSEGDRISYLEFNWTRP